MSPGVRGEIVLAMAWLLFPMLPVILEEFYYQLCVNLLGSTRAGPDPHAWAWGTWLVMLGRWSAMGSSPARPPRYRTK